MSIFSYPTLVKLEIKIRIKVWNKNGALLGKILLGLEIASNVPGVPEGRGCANLVFVPGGLLMFSEDRMYLAKIKAKGALLP